MRDVKTQRRIVKEYLEKTGKTQKELAQMSGLNPKTVSRFLIGNKPSSWDTMLHIFVAIAKELTIDKYWEFVLTDKQLRDFIVLVYEDKELTEYTRNKGR